MSREVILDRADTLPFDKPPVNMTTHIVAINRPMQALAEQKNLGHTFNIAANDVAALDVGALSYGDSWCKRGGTGAFHVGLARKWDRIELQAKRHNYDIFEAIKQDRRPEGIMDDIRDLRRYLLLVEAQARVLGLRVPNLAKDSIDGTDRPTE